MAFPRSIDRGSIEAPDRQGTWIVVSTFRDQLIAAPLKRLLVEPMGTDHRRFPRSIDRGSIEASGQATLAELLHRFPRSIDRGSIEATPCNRHMTSSPPFRDQLIAAPLKREAGRWR